VTQEATTANKKTMEASLNQRTLDQTAVTKEDQSNPKGSNIPLQEREGTDGINIETKKTEEMVTTEAPEDAKPPPQEQPKKAEQDRDTPLPPIELSPKEWQ